MRAWRFILALFLVPGSLSAGVYNLAEVHPFIPVERTREYLLEVRSAAIDLKKTPSPESFRGQVLRQVAALEKARDDGLLSTHDRINLSACYLRLGQPPQAVRLLLAGDSSHFLIQANLAAAYFLSGEQDLAIRHQQFALDRWPTVFAGWTDQQLQNYRECERALLRVMQGRAQEARVRSTAPADVDPVFPGLRFVSASGEYAAGELAPAMRDRLPTNAFPLVFQLCLWFPADMRLYWLLGEMLNALGQVDQADTIFNDLVYLGYSRTFRDLHRHRRELIEVARAARGWKELPTRGGLLSAAMALSRGAPGGGVGSGVGHLVGSWAAAVRATQDDLPLLPLAGDGRTAPAALVMPFNWRHVAVSFAFGVLATVLLTFQWRLLRRRPARP